jgi:release factor glutamine methyltransferase
VTQRWTIRSLLTWVAQDFSTLGIASARLDAELLVAHALGVGRVQLYLDLDRPLSPEELAGVRALVVRRRKREPVAYIVGQREFYRRAFEVDPAVLIPRPDTETLIERALERLPPESDARVLDLCTGSGAIAVTLAAERPGLRVTATDISAAALALAQKNALRHGVLSRIDFVQGDLFAALAEPALFELIVANPPYIAEADHAQLQPEIRLHEPAIALRSGADGLAHLRRLCAESSAWLTPGAAVLFEVGQSQAPAVLDLLRTADLSEPRAHRDLGGIERVVEAELRTH